MCQVPQPPLRTQVIAFLGGLSGLFTPQDFYQVVSAAGFGQLYSRVHWDDTAMNVWAEVVDQLALEGQAQLAGLLANLENSQSIQLGDQDHQKRITLRDAVMVLSPEQWQAEFPVSEQVRRERAARSASTRSATINAGLAARRAAVAAGPARRKRYKIDEKVIWQFDLDQQIAPLPGQLGPPSRPGVFPFVTSGNKQFLEEYVIPRIKRYMEERLFHAVDEPVKKVALNSADLADADRALAATDARLQAIYGVRLADLVDRKGTDCFLVILNQNIRPEQADGVQRFMTSLARDVAHQLGPKIQENSLLLVIIWADVDTGQTRVHPAYCCVPAVEPFEDAFVIAWFTKQLRDAPVDEPAVQTGVATLRQRLLASGGNPWDVYTALRDTTEALRQGRI